LLQTTLQLRDDLLDASPGLLMSVINCGCCELLPATTAYKIEQGNCLSSGLAQKTR
jgi:hypothetical protein